MTLWQYKVSCLYNMQCPCPRTLCVTTPVKTYNRDCTWLNFTVIHSVVLYCIVITVLYVIVLHLAAVLYYSKLYCILPNCRVLYMHAQDLYYTSQYTLCCVVLNCNFTLL